VKKLAIVLALLACAAGAQAQSQWRLNNIGLYTHFGDWHSYCDPNAGTGIHHIYVVGTNLTAASCKGVEFELHLAGYGQMANFTFPEGFDFGGLRNSDHTIGYTNPEPIINAQFVFAEFDLLIYDAGGPTLGYLGPVYFHTLDDPFPAYLDGEDPTLETVIPLLNSVGLYNPTDMTVPVLVMNSDCWVIPNEDVSFGEVKALFH
jgi:hypothetical protein